MAMKGRVLWPIDVHFLKSYNMCFHHWDDDGHELSHPHSFPVPDGPPFRLVLIMHNESTFFQNDHRKIMWGEKTSWPAPQPKGEGQSIMTSDFLTSEWGHLRDGNESIASPSFPFLFTNLSLGRLGLFSRLKRIGTGISALKNSLHKSIRQSTYLKAFPRAFQRHSSFLTMHRATKSEPQMHYLHRKCRKVRPFPPFTFISLIFLNSEPKKG